MEISYKEVISRTERFEGLKKFINILIPKMEQTPDELMKMPTKNVNPEGMELAIAIKDYIDTGDDFRFRQII